MWAVGQQFHLSDGMVRGSTLGCILVNLIVHRTCTRATTHVLWRWYMYYDHITYLHAHAHKVDVGLMLKLNHNTAPTCTSAYKANGGLIWITTCLISFTLNFDSKLRTWTGLPNNIFAKIRTSYEIESSASSGLTIVHASAIPSSRIRRVKIKKLLVWLLLWWKNTVRFDNIRKRIILLTYAKTMCQKCKITTTLIRGLVFRTWGQTAWRVGWMGKLMDTCIPGMGSTSKRARPSMQKVLSQDVERMLARHRFPLPQTA